MLTGFNIICFGFPCKNPVAVTLYNILVETFRHFSLNVEPIMKRKERPNIDHDFS